MTIRKRFICTAAILLALLMAVIGIGGCKLTPDSQPESTGDPSEEPVSTPWPENADAELTGAAVIMRCKDVECTLYDYGQAMYSSQSLQYYMYGMITTEAFFNNVTDELKSLVLLVCAAKDSGMELGEAELLEVDKTISDHLENVLKSYEERVEEGAADKRAAAKELLEQDLEQDGLNYDLFVRLATENIRMHELADKYFKSLADSVKVSDDEVRKYLDEKLKTAADESVSDFVADMTGFFDGNAPYPVYIVDDCFSVNHIYLSYEFDSSGDNYDEESRLEDEAKIEAALPELADYEAFMELETEYGDDPGMDNENYREYGYVIHPDLINDYFEGFVFAAMNLHEGSWHAPHDPSATPSTVGATEPILKYFTLKDGTKIVKVRTESGVHYLIVNKEYKRGPVEYTIGDEKWESWRNDASNDAMNELYKQLSEEWNNIYTIETDMATIFKMYAPEEEAGEETAVPESDPNKK